MRRRRAVLTGVALVALLSAAQLVALVVHIASSRPAGGDLEGAPPGAGPVPAERTVAPYTGYGTWVDIYDFVPGLQGGGARPPVTPDDVDDMADQGVRTLYLQAAHDHPRTPGPVLEPGLVGEFLARAHERGVRVVGWYLPRFGDVERDLAHVEALSSFEAGGHRFDGVALDIEWTRSVTDHRDRSARLVELSERLREVVGDTPVGAIVLAPVHLEEVNRRMWPGFPWQDLAALYDVWLPMGYWTDRRADSGWRDAGRYTRENVERLRDRLGGDAADVVVHPIGGIGDDATAEDLTSFAEALRDLDVPGASVYDWHTLSAAERDHLEVTFNP